MKREGINARRSIIAFLKGTKKQGLFLKEGPAW
jgi:hypothetical protein